MSHESRHHAECLDSFIGLVKNLQRFPSLLYRLGE